MVLKLILRALWDETCFLGARYLIIKNLRPQSSHSSQSSHSLQSSQMSHSSQLSHSSHTSQGGCVVGGTVMRAARLISRLRDNNFLILSLCSCYVSTMRLDTKCLSKSVFIKVIKCWSYFSQILYYGHATSFRPAAFEIFSPIIVNRNIENCRITLIK